MNKENFTVNEHYIPRFLLELFKDDDKAFYYMNNDTHYISKVSTKNACCKKDLYETKAQISENEYYFSRNDIEDNLSKREEEYSKLVKKIISICDNPENKYALILNKEEKELLMEFIANLHLRHPERLNEYKDDIPFTEKGNQILQESNDLEKEIQNNGLLEITKAAFHETRIKQTVLPKEGSYVEYIKEKLLKGSFFILKATKENFLISDNIAFFSKDNIIYVPLSCNYAVFASFNKDVSKQKRQNRLCEIDENIVKEINIQLYQNAQKYIYGKKITLEKLKKDIENKH